MLLLQNCVGIGYLSAIQFCFDLPRDWQLRKVRCDATVHLLQCLTG